MDESVVSIQCFIHQHDNAGEDKLRFDQNVQLWTIE